MTFFRKNFQFSDDLFIWPFSWRKPLLHNKNSLNLTFLVTSYFPAHPITLLLKILGGRIHRPSPSVSNFGGLSPQSLCPWVTVFNSKLHYVMFWVFNTYDASLYSTFVTQGPKTRHLLFLAFYWVIFYTASASKYFFQNANVLFLTEVILVWLEQSKKWEKSYKKFKIFVWS